MKRSLKVTPSRAFKPSFVNRKNSLIMLLVLGGGSSGKTFEALKLEIEVARKILNAAKLLKIEEKY